MEQGMMGKVEQIYATVRLSAGKLQLATTTAVQVDGVLYPAEGHRMGVVLIDSKKHLGVEEQAVPVLKKLFAKAGCSSDGFGDIDWYKAEDGLYTFSWLGPNKVRWNPKTFSQADSAKQARFQDGEYQVLNKVEMKAIDARPKVRKKKTPLSKLTEMISWRGGSVEFVIRSALDGERATQPPWYVVEVSGGVWGDHKWYSWVDYRGPPKLFLTRHMASRHAREMRDQYKCRTRVVPVGPTQGVRK